MDGWNTTFILGRPIFRSYESYRRYVSYREGKVFVFTHINCVFAPFDDMFHDSKMSSWSITWSIPTKHRQSANSRRVTQQYRPVYCCLSRSSRKQIILLKTLCVSGRHCGVHSFPWKRHETTEATCETTS